MATGTITTSFLRSIDCNESPEPKNPNTGESWRALAILPCNPRTFQWTKLRPEAAKRFVLSHSTFQEGRWDWNIGFLTLKLVTYVVYQPSHSWENWKGSNRTGRTTPNMSTSSSSEPVTMTLRGKVDTAVWLRILRWRDSGGPKIVTMILMRGHRSCQSRGRRWHDDDKHKDGVIISEDEGKGPKPRNTGSHWKSEKANKQILLTASQKNQPYWHLPFSPVKLILTFWPPEL